MMMPVLFATVSHRRHRVRAAVAAGALVAGLGTVLTASSRPGVKGLVLSADESTLYAAAVDADAIVAVDTEKVTETARYSTGADTEPMYVAAAGDKIWFGYGPDGGKGGLGSLDPAVGQ